MCFHACNRFYKRHIGHMKLFSFPQVKKMTPILINAFSGPEKTISRKLLHEVFENCKMICS